MIPQLDYCTNDIWELAAGYGTDNNFPIVLRCKYGDGTISIITVPDNMADLYHYPAPVLNVIRGLFNKEIPVMVEGPAQVQLFTYSNGRGNGKTIDHAIVRSDLPYAEQVTLKLPEGVCEVKELISGEKMPVVDGKITFGMTPCVNYVYELIYQ